MKKEIRAICKVQAYVVPEEFNKLETLSAKRTMKEKRKISVSEIVRDFIKDGLAKV